MDAPSRGALLNACGTDSYEGRDEQPADESTPPADTFLARLCVDWEREALRAEELGLRVVMLRTCSVVAADAASLRLLCLPFRLFVGGRIGSGQQWMSWIDMSDAVGLYLHALESDAISGPINLAAPDPRRQVDFARALGAVLHRPSWFPTPAWARAPALPRAGNPGPRQSPRLAGEGTRVRLHLQERPPRGRSDRGTAAARVADVRGCREHPSVAARILGKGFVRLVPGNIANATLRIDDDDRGRYQPIFLRHAEVERPALRSAVDRHRDRPRPESDRRDAAGLHDDVARAAQVPIVIGPGGISVWWCVPAAPAAGRERWQRGPGPDPACCNRCMPIRVSLYVCTDCPARLATDLDGAFATLVAHHQDLVFGMARRMTGNPEDAEDLAQEAFLRAYRALGGYQKARIRELRLRGWLAQITLNLGRNRARDAGPATTELEAAVEPADPARDRPESVAERREAARYWQGLLTELPPRFRRAVELRHVEGLSYGELAAGPGQTGRDRQVRRAPWHAPAARRPRAHKRTKPEIQRTADGGGSVNAPRTMKEARTMVEALRELEVAAPPTLAPRVLAAAGLVDAYTQIRGPIGPLLVAWGPDGITAIERAGDESGFILEYETQHGRPLRRVERMPERADAGGRPAAGGRPCTRPAG